MRETLAGAPVASRRLANMTLPKRFALPLFGSDGISSVAYAVDEIIIMLAVAGHAALAYSSWVGLLVAVIGMLIITTYRYNIQQIAAEGNFELVRRRLGARPAVLVGASMLLDFVLTVAVSMSSATGFITSLNPALQQHHTLIAVAMTLLFTLLCTRGLHLMGRIAHVPLYLFLAILGVTLITGLIQDATGTLGYAETAEYHLIHQDHDGFKANEPLVGAALFMLLGRAFSAGSVALSGVTTISNSARFFRAPKPKNASKTLMIMGAITGVLMIAILYLAHRTGVVVVADPTVQLLIHDHPASADYRQHPALYQLTQAIFGNTLISMLLVYTTVAVLLVASFSAFIGMPITASRMADIGYLPAPLRTVNAAGLYRTGVLVLGVAASALIIAFEANINDLIQLYLVGMSLTLFMTQVAVVRHRLRTLRITLSRDARRHLLRDIIISSAGAWLTGVVFGVVVITKFTSGAWLSLLLIAILYWIMMQIHAHYQAIDSQTALAIDTPEAGMSTRESMRAAAAQAADAVALPSRVHAIVYVERVRKPALRALAYARASRPSTIEALTVNNDPDTLSRVKKRWDILQIPVQLSVIDSPYRDTVSSVLAYIRRMRKKSPRDVIVVYLPEFVVEHWWQRILHRRTVQKLKKALLHEPGVMTATVPWAMNENDSYDGLDEIAPVDANAVREEHMYRGRTTNAAE